VLACCRRAPAKRDRAKAEVGTQVAEHWIVAVLRHRKFFSLEELNRVIGELLDKLNQRPFKRREGSRRSLFLEVDQPALRSLPAERFDLSVWSQATVNIDYHIQFDSRFYRVPCRLVPQASACQALCSGRLSRSVRLRCLESDDVDRTRCFLPVPMLETHARPLIPAACTPVAADRTTATNGETSRVPR
jgi:hypothetical protein